MKTKNVISIISLLAIVLAFSPCGKKADSAALINENFYLNVNIDGIEHSFNKMVFVNASSLKVGLIAITTNDR